MPARAIKPQSDVLTAISTSTIAVLLEYAMFSIRLNR